MAPPIKLDKFLKIVLLMSKVAQFTHFKAAPELLLAM